MPVISIPKVHYFAIYAILTGREPGRRLPRKAKKFLKKYVMTTTLEQALELKEAALRAFERDGNQLF